MRESELKQRTKKFALNIMELVDRLPNTSIGRSIGWQLIRCGTSVGANYRSACRGRSKREFISKLGIVLEEADESAFWLELIVDGKILKHGLVDPILKEANELSAIFTASIKTSKNNSLGKKKSKIKNLRS